MNNQPSPLAQTRRERKKIEIRRTILASARLLFEQKGYESTSIDEIAEQADISRSTFFNYYPTKEALLRGLYEEEAQDITYYLEHDLKECSSPIDKLFKLMLFWVDDTITFRNTVGKILINGISDEDELSTGFVQICNDLVLEAQQANEIDPSINPYTVALMLMGIYYSVLLHTPSSSQDYVIRVYDMLSAILRGIAGSNYVQPSLNTPVKNID